MRFFTRGMVVVALIGLALLGLAGCRASLSPLVPPKTEAQRIEELLADVAELGLTLGDPLALPPEVLERAASAMGPRGTVSERMKRLANWLVDADGLHFRYDAMQTLTASAAYQARTGDCLSYAHLFNALARSMQVPMEYVRFRTPHSYEERAGQFIVVTHVASLFDRDRETILVDLSGEQHSAYRSDYQRLTDREALVLHLSNLSMAALGRGEITRAERLSRRLLAEAPHLVDLHNNLGAVLLRRHRFAETLELLQAALRRFPSNVQLYVNASLAARGLGDPALAAELAAKADAPWTDPFVPFVRGAQMIDEGRLEEGVALLRSVVERTPESATFQLYLARGLLLLGKRKEAVDAFTRASKLDHRHPLLAPVSAQLGWPMGPPPPGSGRRQISQ